MKSGAFKRALGLAFLYLGLFVVIVLVQFSRAPGLSEKYGALSVNASYQKANRGRAGLVPEKVRFSYAGLAFEISPKSPVESLGADGAASALALASVDKLPNGVRIKLSPGVEVRATSDRGTPERFVLAATAPEGVSVLRLRVAPSREVRFSEADGRRGLSFSGASYDLALGSATLDPSAGILSLRPGDSGLALSRIPAPMAVKPSPPAEGSVAQAPKDPDAFKAEISAWRDKVWSGIATTRFDADKLAWKGPDSASAFSEKALAAYLAESLARGVYSDALARARGAKDKWPDKLGYLSAPYLGGLVPKMKAFEASDLAEAKRLAQLVADKSPMILEKEGLLWFLIDRSPSSLAQDALRYLAGLDPAKLTVRQAIGLLGCVADSKSLLKDEGNPLRNQGAVADRLVAAVRKSQNGYFLITEDDGSTDLRLSLLAGVDLVAYGTASSKPALIGAGQSLVEGVLGLADAQGFEPSDASSSLQAPSLSETGRSCPRISIPSSPTTPITPTRRLSPSTSRPASGHGPALPRSPCRRASSRYLFLATFPAGRSHYLSFYGIKPFANIQLYDIDYNPDNDFESYDASGYLYNKSAARFI
jgi:hypothetical protein